MKISENFTLEEMIFSSVAARLGIKNIPDDQQISNLIKLCQTILQPIRQSWGRPIIVTSGFRSPILNKKIGGAPTSQHLSGEAADIISDNNAALWKLIVDMIKTGEITVGQLIDERNLKWIHVSLPDPRHQNQILSIK